MSRLGLVFLVVLVLATLLGGAFGLVHLHQVEPPPPADVEVAVAEAVPESLPRTTWLLTAFDAGVFVKLIDFHDQQYDQTLAWLDFDGGQQTWPLGPGTLHSSPSALLRAMPLDGGTHVTLWRSGKRPLERTVACPVDPAVTLHGDLELVVCDGRVVRLTDGASFETTSKVAALWTQGGHAVLALDVGSDSEILAHWASTAKRPSTLLPRAPYPWAMGDGAFTLLQDDGLTSYDFATGKRLAHTEAPFVAYSAPAPFSMDELGNDRCLLRRWNLRTLKPVTVTETRCRPTSAEFVHGFDVLTWQENRLSQGEVVNEADGGTHADVIGDGSARLACGDTWCFADDGSAMALAGSLWVGQRWEGLSADTHLTAGQRVVFNRSDCADLFIWTPGEPYRRIEPMGPSDCPAPELR